MKIGFTVDTNIIEGKDGRTTSLYRNLSYFTDYIAVLQKKDHNNSLIFYLTDIVKEEVIQHEKDKMEADYKRLEIAYNNAKYLLKDEIPNNTIDSTIEEEKKYVEKLNILKLDTSEKKFKKIIQMSIEKKPPFVKNNGDAGFKDSLIWETILDSKKIDECDLFYYFTSDSDFNNDINKKLLEEEFKIHHNHTDIIIKPIEPNDSKRQKCLSTIIEDNKLMNTDITELYNEITILNIIKDLPTEEVEITNYDNKKEKIKIHFDQFTENNITIKNVESKNNKYIISIEIHRYKIDKDILHNLDGYLNITIHKNDGKYYQEKYTLNNMRYREIEVNDYLKSINTLVGITEPIRALKTAIDNTDWQSTFDRINLYQEPLKNITDKMQFFTPIKDYNTEWLNTLNDLTINQLNTNLSSALQTIKMPSITDIAAQPNAFSTNKKDE